MAASSEHVASKAVDRAPFRAAWVPFVAGRYLRTRRRERRNATAVLSVLGLAVGVTTLVTVLAVMNALQARTIESIVSFNSFHVRIGGLTAQRLIEEPARLQDLRRKVPAIRSLVQFADIQGMARGWFSGSEGLRIRAVPPDILGLDADLAAGLRMAEGAFAIDSPGTVVLGHELARALGVNVGDRLSVLAVGGTSRGAGEPVGSTLTVTGVFRVDYWDFDRYCAFVSLDTGRLLVGGALAPSLGLKLAERDTDWLAGEDIARQLVSSRMASKTVLARDLQTWRQYNAAIFGALRVEKLLMVGIVGLVFVVVAVNIFHALRRSVAEKAEDIGVLRALGARPGSIRLVFVMEGVGIGLAGALIGFGLGWLVATRIADIFWLLEGALTQLRAWWVQLSGGGAAAWEGRVSLFYLDRVPSRPDLAESVSVALAAFAAAVGAALAASRRVSRMAPADILRTE